MMNVLLTLGIEDRTAILEQKVAETMNSPQRRFKIMGHRVAKGFHLLVGSGEFFGPFLHLRLDLGVNRVQFNLPRRNEIHFAQTLTNRNSQKDHFKGDPPCMFDCSPWTGIEDSINGLRPVEAADHMIDINDCRSCDENPPIPIESEDGQI